MRKKYQEKRTKFTVDTYMYEAIDYDIDIIKEDDLFITIKKYKKMTNKISFSDDEGNYMDYINNGYYLLELTPLKENYNMRFYINDKKEIISYYIDITLKNYIKYHLPCYIDLYLDIVHYPHQNVFKFYDEDELKEALDNKIISKKDYNLAYKVGNRVLKEINNKTNKYFNMDIIKYIK